MQTGRVCMETPERTDELWILFRHFFPDLSRNHARIYRLLWRIEPLDGEAIIKEVNLARATVYRALNDLSKVGLIKKTSQPKVRYYAENPTIVYSEHLNQLSKKLKRGQELIKQIMENETSLSEELYLVELDGGQKRLISKKGRQTVLDEFILRDIRRTVDLQIKQVEQSKLKSWMTHLR